MCRALLIVPPTQAFLLARQNSPPLSLLCVVLGGSLNRPEQIVGRQGACRGRRKGKPHCVGGALAMASTCVPG